MNQRSTSAYEGRVKYSEAKARSYQSVKERKNRAELKLAPGLEAAGNKSGQ
jgi:hypothetical protein